MYFDAIVQSAFVVIFAWLIQMGANAVGFSLDAETTYALAGAFVAYIVAKLGLGVVRAAFVKRGGLK